MAKAALHVPGWYAEVNEDGDVWSLPRVRIRSNGRPFTVAGKLLVPHWNEQHWQVRVCPADDGVIKWRYVHVLVLETFVGPRPEGYKGLHRDDDPHNNHVSNLYWGTLSDNAFDRVRNGRDPNFRKTKCNRGHSLEGPNLASWTKTGRCCLACNRAKTHARYLGRQHDEEFVQALSDEKFVVITGVVV